MTDPSSGKMLAVEIMFSFYFGTYSGAMLGALVEIVPTQRSHNLLFFGLRTRRSSLRHVYAARIDVPDRTDR